MWRLGNLTGRLWRRRHLPCAVGLVAGGGLSVRRAGVGMLGLEPEDVLVGAHRRTLGRRRTRHRVDAKELGSQQPDICLVAAFLHRGWFVNQGKGFEPGRGPAGNESVAVGRLRRGCVGREAREIRGLEVEGSL